jgi:hypothetical protein
MVLPTQAISGAIWKETLAWYARGPVSLTAQDHRFTRKSKRKHEVALLLAIFMGLGSSPVLAQSANSRLTTET